jgi:WD40 repeat protein
MVKALRSTHGDPSAIAYAPDGSRLAVATRRGHVLVWDLGEKEDEPVDLLHAEETIVLALDFSPDGKQLASGGRDGRVCLWDVSQNRETATLEGHQYAVHCVDFSPDGKTLVSSGGQFRWFDFNPAKIERGPGELILWDVASGRPIYELPEQYFPTFQARFLPDGKSIASTNLFLLNIWDISAILDGTWKDAGKAP